MTNNAFHELVATFVGFLCLYTWAIFFVVIGIIASIKLAQIMNELSLKIVNTNNPEQKYSKKSIEGWKNTMCAVWKLGVGSLVPCFIIYSISRYLPQSYLNEHLITIDNNQLMVSQAFLLMQAIVFFALLAVKYRAITDCYSAMQLAKESGL